MKRAQYHNWGDNQVVHVEEVEKPTIAPDEVLVEVKAAGVNPIDWKVREGYYAELFNEPFPFPMGWDFCGKIQQVGGDVQNFKQGDDVYGLIRFFEPAGCFAEYVSAPASQISLKPQKLDHIQAAGVPLVALTAWQALFETSSLKANQKVLIHAGAGAVGQMAIQLAKYTGAYVIATGSDKGKDMIQRLGADQFINYQTEQFHEMLTDIDLVLDLVGGENTERSLKVLKDGGQLICFTQPIGPEVEAAAKSKNIDAQFTIVKPNGKQLQSITQLIDDGILKIQTEKTFPLSQIKEALDLQQSGHCHGKIILTM